MLEKEHSCTRLHLPVIPALRKLRHEDDEFKTREREPASKHQIKKMEEDIREIMRQVLGSFKVIPMTLTFPLRNVL